MVILVQNCKNCNQIGNDRTSNQHIDIILGFFYNIHVYKVHNMLACLTLLQDLWLFVWSQIFNSLGWGLSIMTSSWLLRINLMINYFLLVKTFFKFLFFKKWFWRYPMLKMRKTIAKIARFLYLVFSCIVKM